MGQRFTTETYSIGDRYISLYRWNNKEEKWSLPHEINEDVMHRLRHVIDMKRQIRCSSERVYGWHVDKSFVPWREIDPVSILRLSHGDTPFFRAIYRDDDNVYHNREQVRIPRLCVLKKHLDEALSGETPRREPKRDAIIRAMCSAWEISVIDKDNDLPAISEN